MRKITLEEHIATPGLGSGVPGKAEFNAALQLRMSDLESYRLPEMDEAGIDVQVLSLTWPGVQAIPDPAEAVRCARESNDTLAEWIARHPTRFAGFASLPCQSPGEAADELERCVTEHGFKGALVNGHTRGMYLDDERMAVLWERLCQLHVPLYLHPTFSPEPSAFSAGFPELGGSLWGWAAETGGHALRLVASGTFDKFPEATVILGHMGENLPYCLWRIDDRWKVRDHEPVLSKQPSEYVRDNMVITTAGVCSSPALRCAIDTLGVGNVLFSVDYPFQSASEAAEFIETAALSDEERRAICSGNAERILGL